MDDLTRRNALKMATVGVLGVAAGADAQEPAKVPAKSAGTRRFDRVEIVSNDIGGTKVSLTYIREYARPRSAHDFEVSARYEGHDHAFWHPAESGEMKIATLDAMLRIVLSEVEWQGLNFSARVRLDAQKPDKTILIILDETVAVRFFVPAYQLKFLGGQELPHISFGKLGEPGTPPQNGNRPGSSDGGRRSP